MNSTGGYQTFFSLSWGLRAHDPVPSSAVAVCKVSWWDLVGSLPACPLLRTLLRPRPQIGCTGLGIAAKSVPDASRCFSSTLNQRLEASLQFSEMPFGMALLQERTDGVSLTPLIGIEAFLQKCFN